MKLIEGMTLMTKLGRIYCGHRSPSSLEEEVHLGFGTIVRLISEAQIDTTLRKSTQASYEYVASPIQHRLVYIHDDHSIDNCQPSNLV